MPYNIYVYCTSAADYLAGCRGSGSMDRSRNGVVLGNKSLTLFLALFKAGELIGSFSPLKKYYIIIQILEQLDHPLLR